MTSELRPAMQVELKPCPFCGGEAVDFYRRNTGATADWCGPVDHWVSCTGNCGAATCMHGTKDEAIAAWNTRHQARAEVVGDIVAWLRGNCMSGKWRILASEIEERFGTPNVAD